MSEKVSKQLRAKRGVANFSVRPFLERPSWALS
jgi:hypothetical protein